MSALLPTPDGPAPDSFPLVAPCAYVSLDLGPRGALLEPRHRLTLVPALARAYEAISPERLEREPWRCGLCHRRITGRHRSKPTPCERCGDLFHWRCYWRVASVSERFNLEATDQPHLFTCHRCRS